MSELRSLVDRILRVKEEQDTLGKDIREIYAEARHSGFDKTVLGKLVSHLRKIEKDGANSVEEIDNLFDIYLNVYRGTGTEIAIKERARAHACEPSHDPETGELTEAHAQPSREEIKAQATRHRMEDTAELAIEAQRLFGIAPEVTAETIAMAQSINNKWGDGKPLELTESAVATKPAPAGDQAVSALAGAPATNSPGQVVSLAATSNGDSSPTLAEKDLREVGTAQFCGAPGQEPHTGDSTEPHSVAERVGAIEQDGEWSGLGPTDASPSTSHHIGEVNEMVRSADPLDAGEIPACLDRRKARAAA